VEGGNDPYLQSKARILFVSRIRQVVTFFMLNFGQNAGIDELQKKPFHAGR